MNVDTCTSVAVTDLTIDSENADVGDEELIYVPSPVLALRALNSVLPADVSDFVFVDFGSGKGRVLFFASQFNFGKIIGVEFAKELHARANENIRRCRHPKQACFDIESILVDATVFQIPDNKCVFFLFHPFTEYVLSKVVNKIRDSYLANPRHMYVIYFNPVHAKVFDSLDMFKQVKSRRRSLRGVNYNFTVYQANAPSSDDR